MSDLSASDDIVERLRIREVLERYFYAHDYHLFDRLETCFTDDVQASYLNGAVRVASRKELIQSMQSPASFAFKHQAHTTSHCHIDLHKDTAESDTLAVIFFAQGQAGADVLVRGARYLDKLRRETNGWRIYEREHRSLWQCQVPEQALGFPAARKS